jgi:hypothetical protein
MRVCLNHAPVALTDAFPTTRALTTYRACSRAHDTQAMMEQKIYEMARAAEDAVDDEMHRLDKMGGDDLEELRRKRLESMQTAHAARKSYLERGHGVVNDLDDERAFFDKMKGEDKMIVHFYRPSSWPCEVMAKHLEVVAQKHVETLVCRINAEKSPFLTERLKIWMLPTLCLVRNTQVTDYIVGFDDVGGSDDFPTEHLRLVLASKGLINYEGGDNDVDANPRAGKKPVNVVEKSNNLRRGSKMALNSDDESSDFDD